MSDEKKDEFKYHGAKELLEHRYVLFIVLCYFLNQTKKYNIWRSRLHSDGTMFDETCFVMGVNIEQGEQITYHLPLIKWEQTNFAATLGNAPSYDGHSSNDVLLRLQKLITDL